ncbi:hypothetical protein KAS08_05450 [Candidatus Pacearchaeota archaeon]|nr:hypothetical protein [Candidatus Pacearchaeota archaeon]
MFGTKVEAKKEPVKKPRKKPAVKKTVSVSMTTPGKKKFSSPEEVTAYYKAEGERVKEALREFKLKQAELQLQLARQEYMKISSQKKDLDELKVDLDGHRKEVETKIKQLNGMKEKEVIHQKVVNDFTKKMKGLEKESKKIMNTREALIYHQNELIYKMKNLAKESNTKFKATDLPTSEDLFKFEASKGEVLAKSKEILSEEMKGMLSDHTLLDSIDNKTAKKLGDLNIKIIEVQNVKKDTMKKLELLDMSEEKAAKEMAKSEEKVKKLEITYKNLLKK